MRLFRIRRMTEPESLNIESRQGISGQGPQEIEFPRWNLEPRNPGPNEINLKGLSQRDWHPLFDEIVKCWDPYPLRLINGRKGSW